jgi:hypothetical protein
MGMCIDANSKHLPECNKAELLYNKTRASQQHNSLPEFASSAAADNSSDATMQAI